MLGEKVGTMSGPTSLKALPATNGNPTFETSAIGLTGTLAGADVQSHATYSAELRPNGTLLGECPNAGFVMAADGLATFRATGIGRFTEDGGADFKGVVYF